jgi:N6-L-threonylcarbamoyladenine synthase
LFIEKDEILPCTILLVSGGHTQIIEANSYEDMKIIASTMDDSFGESFDKVAKMMNLGYPGGPIVQELSQKGDKNRFNLPIPLRQSPKIEFSYSGLKNAVRLEIEKIEELSSQDKADICASFQKTAVAHIMQKIKKYFKTTIPKNFAIVGGASANIYLRTQLEELCNKHNTKLHLSQLKYCSDNAAMIGRVAIEQFERKEFVSIDEIDVQTRIKNM